MKRSVRSIESPLSFLKLSKSITAQSTNGKAVASLAVPFVLWPHFCPFPPRRWPRALLPIFCQNLHYSLTQHLCSHLLSVSLHALAISQRECVSWDRPASEWASSDLRGACSPAQWPPPLWAPQRTSATCRILGSGWAHGAHLRRRQPGAWLRTTFLNAVAEAYIHTVAVFIQPVPLQHHLHFCKEQGSPCWEEWEEWILCAYIWTPHLSLIHFDVLLLHILFYFLQLLHWGIIDI